MGHQICLLCITLLQMSLDYKVIWFDFFLISVALLFSSFAFTLKQ